MTSLPSSEALAEWLRENPKARGLRDVARAFGLKTGPERAELKRLLIGLEREGQAPARPRRGVEMAGSLPEVSILTVGRPDADGDVFASPARWEGEGAPPRILLLTEKGDRAAGPGDRVLARLLAVKGSDHDYQARIIRHLPPTQGASGEQRILGLFRASAEGGRIQPVTRGTEMEWLVPSGETASALDGELVEGERIGGPRLGLPRAKVSARLGNPGAARSVSLIAIHAHGIPDHFPDAVLQEAEALLPPEAKSREDLTGLPLLTIDPADARDHDDAVCALPDPEQAGGFLVWVAIADVAAHVRPGTPLDREARLRGNSTYFPDRVVPMLPERLSADLCSLIDGVGRPVIAVCLKIGADGAVRSHRFTRGWMNSRASLSYEAAQAAFEGHYNADTQPLAAELGDLLAAWHTTRPQREARQPLDLDLPERRIELDAAGVVTTVAFKERLDAHRLIEDFMILANVAAAETLIAKKKPLLFRVHEEPEPSKLEALRDVAGSAGLKLAKGQVLGTRHLNKLLRDARESEFNELINMSVLRSMPQANYGTQNFGHFGLALRNYAHFTSPIRRYADLLLHRALISAHGWGHDGLSADDIAEMAEIGTHISNTERRSMAAERETSDRYLAAFLGDRIGASFDGRISGVARFGLFVKLEETGADGLVPIRSLGDEYFRHDQESQTLRGEKSNRVLGLGQRVVVKLAEAEPATGGLILELLEVDGKAMPKSGRAGRAAPRKGKIGKAAGKRALTRKR